MQIQLTFRRMNPTNDVEKMVFRAARRLERVSPKRLTWCQVLIEQPHRHKHVGRPCRVRVSVQGVGGYYVASAEFGEVTQEESLHVALSEAFRAVLSQLRGAVRERDDLLMRRHGHHGRRMRPWSKMPTNVVR